jgi:hypothetical protein
LKDQRLDLLAANTQHCRDLIMGVISKLEENQRGALIERQPTDLVKQIVQLLSALDQILWAVWACPILYRVIDADRPRTDAKLRQAAIASDRVEPRSQDDWSRSSSQPPVCRDEGQLERILRLFSAPQHVDAEAEYTTRVPIVNRLESRIIAGAHPGNQLLVGAV